VKSAQAMESRPREMAKSLGPTKVGGAIEDVVGGGEAGVREARWTIREMSK
jgi:hypothetical protein